MNQKPNPDHHPEQNEEGEQSLADVLSESHLDKGEMSLIEHLAELRARLLHSLVAVIVGCLVTYALSSRLFEFLTGPFFVSFPPSSLIGTGPAEAFVLKLKVTVVTSIFLVSPYLFYQVWLFVEPGLYPEEKKHVIPFITITTLLFLGGAALAYFVMLPIAFEFFLSQYNSIGITPQIRISEHLALTLRVLVASGVLFEMPILTYLLARSGIITKQMLIASTRYAIVAIFVVSAIATPPDVLTQFLFAIPLMILYGISIVVAGYAERK
jgi:sec-independent protein translocase protein TatC